MPDTRREKAALQALHPDNTAGDIAAQDVRDGWETCHPAAVVQTAAFASEPASGQVTGDLFLPSDSFYVERYGGSAWAPWGPIYPLTRPVSGDFAWINQGSASVVTTYGGVHLTCVADAGVHSLKIRKKSAPATPYTITAALLHNADWSQASTSLFGLCFRQSSDGKLATLGIQMHSVGLYLPVSKFDSPTGLNSHYVAPSNPAGARGLWWLRIADDGTNRKCSTSADGQNWIQMHSVGRTDFLTADEVGFWIAPHSQAQSITLLSWKQA
jgi:hypothetical protein